MRGFHEREKGLKPEEMGATSPETHRVPEEPKAPEKVQLVKGISVEMLPSLGIAIDPERMTPEENELVDQFLKKVKGQVGAEGNTEAHGYFLREGYGGVYPKDIAELNETLEALRGDQLKKAA